MSDRSLTKKQIDTVHVCVDVLVEMSGGNLPHLMTMVDLVAGMIITTVCVDQEQIIDATEKHADHITLYAETYRRIKEANSGRA